MSLRRFAFWERWWIRRSAYNWAWREMTLTIAQRDEIRRELDKVAAERDRLRADLARVQALADERTADLARMGDEVIFLAELLSESERRTKWIENRVRCVLGDCQPGPVAEPVNKILERMRQAKQPSA